MKFLATVTVLASAALAAPNPSPEPWCYRVGQSCWKVKRTADAFVEAVQSTGGMTTALEGQPDPTRIEEVIALSANDALTSLADLIAYSINEPDIFSRIGAGAQSPAAEEEQNETEKRGVDVQEEKRWCYRVGQSCWKIKRAAEAVLDAAADEVEETSVDKRSPEPWCYRVGQSCWKAKRDLEEEAPEKRWCYRVGQSCWKAKRDLEIVQNAAREILASLD